MREQHESDSEDEEDVVDVARQYFVPSMLVHVASSWYFVPSMLIQARAEAAAEDGLPADHYDRFCRTPVGDFYKNPVRCAAHVVGVADPVKYRKRLETVRAIQRQHDQIRGTQVGDMDHATSGKGPSNEVGEPRGLKEKLIDQIRAIQADRRNALDTLAYERAKFHADCAARNIRTTKDAERAWTRIAVARAKVVRQEI